MPSVVAGMAVPGQFVRPAAALVCPEAYRLSGPSTGGTDGSWTTRTFLK